MGSTGFLQSILGGIGTGSIYALLGLAFALVFGKLRICSYMHGDLAILAAYLGFLGFNSLGIDPLMSLIILIPAFFVIGYFIQVIFMKPFMDMEIWQGRYQAQVMVTWGIAMSIMAVEFMIWSGTYRMIAVPYRNTVAELSSLKMPVVHIMSLVAVVVVYFGLNLILKKTDLGISLRACSDDRVTAMLTGINYQKICAMAFGISSSIAVIAGTFFALTNQITPSVGLDLTFKGWVAVIIGGMGSLGGVIIAGLLIGLVESLTSFFWIPALKNAVLFIGLLILLVVKPSGLFGKK
ncbi:branched-chain amino acid ABC transporter permease [Acidaminobacter hydrogenoformans]|uniref:Branched-chain amino acid transport system permease protein n=1 Tax=Acidaminobacter hydrogenoformans DSM 2784 TaxID=1120920 RepID=A0A1G5S0Q5_9FIRM|nr:branched-chain amino acid ABC transporter permease [Acidaminobacter hydrogenoformans]SCZ79873.1 branched-chain amino acid transport system permease protein [Acidaminobacter hydrogenoformans DSM 2784]